MFLFLANIRNKSKDSKKRILIVLTTIVMMVVIAVWFFASHFISKINQNEIDEVDGIDNLLLLELGDKLVDSFTDTKENLEILYGKMTH